MRGFRFSYLGLVTAAALALPAAGAGAEGLGHRAVTEGPYTAPFSWTGFHVGVAVEYGSGTTESDLSQTDVSLRGVQGVLSAGYDFRVGPRWLLGLFGDYTFGEIDGVCSDLTCDFDNDAKFAIGNQWAVGGRLGLLAAPSTLLYASGGYTRGDFEAFGGRNSFVREALDGFFVGLGVEQAVNRNLSLKLDYRFSDYEDLKLEGINFDNQTHSVRLGASWKFGHDESAALAGTSTSAERLGDRRSIRGRLHVAPPNWTGLYAGIAVGHGIGTAELLDFDEISLRGVQGVVLAGYDFQLGPQWVLSLFGDYVFGESDGLLAAGLKLAIDKQWAIGGRLGLLATPSTLLYASAGYTRADFEAFDGGNTFIDEALHGFFVGVGVEQAINRNLSLKLDYRFSDYEDFRFNVSNVVFDSEIHSVRLGLNWKFLTDHGAQLK
jgi:outer membrane immunogenic protein